MQRLSPRFRSQQFFLCKVSTLRRNFLLKFVEICMETPYWSPSTRKVVFVAKLRSRSFAAHNRSSGTQGRAHSDGLQQGGWKAAETTATEFCYKNVNLSLNARNSRTLK